MSTPSSTYRSDRLRVALLWLAVLPLWLTLGCSGGTLRPFSSFSAYSVAPVSAEAEADARWADYLVRHLSRRAGTRVAVRAAAPGAADAGADALSVSVGVVPALESGYAVTRTDNSLTLRARDEATLLWLVYQFISAAGASDARLATSDLPPAIVDCTADVAADFAFEYRGLYTPSNADADLRSILATHHVDYDWGLWGHNLHKVFPDGVPDEAKALVGGSRSGDQYCFSSAALYAAIEAYVVDGYGEGADGAPVRFAILPNDNDEVCQCAACRAAGNTAASATPAVAQLVSRLARRFPRHLFFTSSYATTVRPPAQPLPANAGVLVSAISVPFTTGFQNTPEGRRFTATLAEWGRVTSRVYVWDYLRNFDDYLTPYPCLHLLWQRLQFYRHHGVSGVFLNGSGDDYATFDDVQTATLAALLVNPDLDVNTYADACWHTYYPVAADVLAPYCRTIEARTLSAPDGKKPPVLRSYAGIGDAVAAYLDPAAFETFCQQLDDVAKTVDGEERTRLNRLLTGLCFTRLELRRLQAATVPYDRDEVEDLLAGLSGHTAFPEMRRYREANGDLDAYIRQWNALLERPRPAAANLLAGVRLKALSALDEGQAALGLLTDGCEAFPTDYHTGWLIASADTLSLEVPAAAVIAAAGTFRLGLLVAPKWRILPPRAVEVWQDGRRVARADVSADAEATAATFARRVVTCPFSGLVPGRPVSLRLLRAAAPRATSACDEIEMYGN